MIKKGPQISKLLNDIFPEGCELSKTARREIERQTLREEATSVLTWMQAAKIERSTLPAWYEHLAAKQDPLGEALRALGYATWLDAIDGDAAARKLFFERYDVNYKPSVRSEQHHTFPQLKPDIEQAKSQADVARSRIHELAGLNKENR